MSYTQARLCIAIGVTRLRTALVRDIMKANGATRSRTDFVLDIMKAKWISKLVCG